MTAATAVRSRRGALIVGGCLVVAIAVTIVLVVRSQAVGASVSDPDASGTITLYDQAGHVITHGSVTAAPFAWKAVSSVPAPPAYAVPGAKATLLAFQPREGVAPPAWSGDTLTASTPVVDPTHPAATANATDFSLQDFLDEFPPRWDGRIELRLYLSAPDAPAQSTRYASAMLAISGGSWSVVSG